MHYWQQRIRGNAWWDDYGWRRGKWDRKGSAKKYRFLNGFTSYLFDMLLFPIKLVSTFPFIEFNFTAFFRNKIMHFSEHFSWDHYNIQHSLLHLLLATFTAIIIQSSNGGNELQLFYFANKQFQTLKYTCELL